MKVYALSASIGLLALVLAGVSERDSGPLTIDLNDAGEAVLITLNGTPAGGLRVDAEGRLGLFGPNRASTIVTIDGQDRVQIDPEPVEAPPCRLTVANDVWLTGVLRVGRTDAFGDAPFDPNGAIQVGRNLSVAQPMALFRAFAQGRESFRLGATAEGDGYWSDGAHDRPLLTFRPSLPGEPETGRVTLYDAEVAVR